MRKTILTLTALLLNLLNAGAQQTDAFPYPSVPDTLRTPETRAMYVMEHYWDRFDFADTTLVNRPEITEQGFANFLDLLPRVKPATAATGLTALATHLYNIKADEKTAEQMRNYFEEIADKYLGDSESPLHNDLLYAQYIDAMTANKFASMADRTRGEYMARNLRKNLPGSVAADFQYTDRNGATHSMHSFNATYTLLYFYDPDCDHCQEVKAELADMPQLTEGTTFRVLAIFPYDVAERWKSVKPDFPASWTDGVSPEGKITTDDIYYIKTMPSLYLLDSEKRVILKNPDLKLLKETVSKLKVEK